VAQILIFRLAERLFGIPAQNVREILRAVSISPLAEAPQAVEGLVNVRGRLVPVVDLRPHFEMPTHPVIPSDHMVLLSSAHRLIALRVDEALELAEVDDAVLSSGQDVAEGIRYAWRVARLPQGLVYLHDLDAVLAQADTVPLDTVVGVP
jgi:purine-binding chemotaxis protein CheW